MKNKDKKYIERLKLLADIKAGRKHTHKNSILAPLSQADLVTYSYPLKGWPAENVKLTTWGETYLSVGLKEYPSIVPDDTQTDSPAKSTPD